MQEAVRQPEIHPERLKKPGTDVVPSRRGNPLRELLGHASVQDLIATREYKGPAGEVISADASWTVEHAMDLLSKHKIWSLPIIANGVCIGMLDARDIATFILSSFPNPDKLQKKDLEALTLGAHSIRKASIKSVLDTSNKEPFVPLFVGAPALQAAELFATGRIHRTVVFNEKKQIVGLVSQADVARFLHTSIKRSPGKLKSMTSNSLETFSTFLSQRIINISANATVFAAIQKLAVLNINALAVIDESGKLIGNFSAGDIRGLYLEHFPHLLGTVVDFLTSHSPESLRPKCGDLHQSLADFIEMLATSKVHRLWIVNAKAEPASLCSLSDICKIVTNFDQTA